MLYKIVFIHISYHIFESSFFVVLVLTCWIVIFPRGLVSSYLSTGWKSKQTSWTTINFEISF